MSLISKFLLALGLTLFCSLASAFAQTTPITERKIKVGKVERHFLTHIPSTAKPGSPLVVLLHGGTSSMRKVLKWPGGQDWRKLSDKHGFVLIVPNGMQIGAKNAGGNKQHWNDHREPNGRGVEAADDVGFIRKVVTWAASDLGINKKRVYVTGASNGGMMTYRMLLEAPEMFAGGAAFIANLPAKTPKLPKRGRAVPLMLANGTKDPLTDWNGGREGARGVKDFVLSTPETLKFWIARNGASSTPSNQRVMPDKIPEDGCKLRIADYPARGNGAKLRFITMEGSGHAVPSRSGRVPQTRLEKRIVGNRCFDANGAAMAWAFLTGTADPR